MKRIIMTVLIITMLTSSQAMARNTGHTTIIGGAAGALFGQAMGRNTEATLIGVALGSVVGYMIGNEMDKGAGFAGPVRTVGPPPGPSRHGYEARPCCRETEIPATINGRPESVIAVACLQNDRWIINRAYRKHNRQRVVINNLHRYPPAKKHNLDNRQRSSRNSHHYRERRSIW